MMFFKLRQLKKDVEKIRLSEEAKKRIHMALVRKIDETRHINQKQLAPSFNSLTFKHPMPIAIILLSLALTGSTAFAAEGALPGDTLYGFKTHINEEVREKFSFTQEQKAEWETRRAERRAQELDRLEAEGRISAELRTQIEARMQVHAHRAQEHAMRVRQQHPQRSQQLFRLEERIDDLKDRFEQLAPEQQERIKAHIETKLNEKIEFRKEQIERESANDPQTESQTNEDTPRATPPPFWHRWLRPFRSDSTTSSETRAKSDVQLDKTDTDENTTEDTKKNDSSTRARGKTDTTVELEVNL